jgi:hypothetical protein
MCIKVPNVVILGVGVLEIMYFNLIVFLLLYFMTR